MLFLKSFMKFWYIVHIVLHTPQLLTMKEAKKGPNILYKTTTWRWAVYWYTTQYTKALRFLSGCLPNRNWVSKNWTWRKTCRDVLVSSSLATYKHHSKAEKKVEHNWKVKQTHGHNDETWWKKKYEKNKLKTITKWWTLTLKRKRYTHVTIVTNYVKKWQYYEIQWAQLTVINQNRKDNDKMMNIDKNYVEPW